MATTTTAQSANYYIGRNRELEQEKQPWLIHYQTLAQIFLTRKMDFLRVITPGEFLQADVFDNSGQYAAYLMASIFLSMLWPDAGRTVVIKPSRRLKGLPGVQKYFNFVTEEIREAMDNPKAGLQLALMEHFMDQGVFGTSAVASEEGPADDASLPVVYDAWGIKGMCISENAQGYVDTVYFVRELRAHQIVSEYSKPGDNVSQKIKDAVAKGGAPKDEKHKILCVIEPKTPEKGKVGVAGMAVRTLHIDIDNSLIMREGGKHEMNVHVGRFFKTMDEPYGRSSGMLALPDAQSLNILTEALLVATEKQLDPPLGVLDAGRLGGGVIDTSAAAINVFDTAGRQTNEKPIFPLFTVGELQSSYKLQEGLRGLIMQAFFLDRLLDLNNQTQMTAYETSVRAKMRGESLGSIFARQQMEVLTPLVERTFNILYRRGQLGVINTGIGAKLRALWKKIKGADDVIVPDAVIQAIREGLDVFEVEYISPAARFMRAENLQGLLTAMGAITPLAPVIPGLTDKIDPDLLVDDIYAFSGAPTTSLRTADDVLKFRAANAEERRKAETMAAHEQAAGTALKLAQGRQALGATPAAAPTALGGM